MIRMAPVERSHREFLQQHNRMVVAETRVAARYIEAEVRRNPGFNPGPNSRLIRSVTGRIIKRGPGSTIVRGHSNSRIAPYNRPIEFGSRPHVIRARRAKALRFVWHGTTMYRKQVNHPGNRPYYFLRSATYAAGYAFETRTRQRMGVVARSF